jgi:DNA processing protein
MREAATLGELPCASAPRRWSSCAAGRIVAALARVTVVVEAEDSASGLAGPRIAQSLGRTVAAVPGRVTSPASRASHALLRDGARLVTSAEDVLDLLCDVDRAPAPGDRLAKLEPRLRAVLESVGAGLDTPQRLIGTAGDAGELSELELMGLLARGDGGRYVALVPGRGAVR